MSRAARLILAIALLATVLVGPAAQSAKAPPSTPTDDQPPMICFEEPCWGNGDECEDECGGGEIIDPCDHVPCDIDHCDYVNCDFDLCDYVNCNPDIPCRDKRCPEVCRPGLDYRECADTVCGYLGLADLSNVAGVDCVKTACNLERDFGIHLVYTGDSDGDGIEDCHDPDVDGDGLSNTLEEAIGYDPSDARSDGDGIPDAFDLMPGTDSKVKVWIRIDTIEQPDWEDDGTGPDPYLKSRAGLSVDGTTPKEANKLSFDGLRQGDHLHDDLSHTFDSETKDYKEVASRFPQEWHPKKYPSLEGGGKLNLEWEMPLWEHDGDHEVGPDCDDLDCAGDDDKASSLDSSDVVLQLLTIAQRGHVPGTISADTEMISGPPGEAAKTKDTWLVFGSDAELKIEIGANLPVCSILLGHHAWDLKGLEDDKEFGNAYVGIGEAPEHGSTLNGVEKNLCDIAEDDGGLLT